KVRLDLPWQVSHIEAALVGHTRALGVDWGLNTLLTATVADLDPHSGVSTDGRALRFDATGVAAKLVRLRRIRERRQTKIDHLVRLYVPECVVQLAEHLVDAAHQRDRAPFCVGKPAACRAEGPGVDAAGLPPGRKTGGWVECLGRGISHEQLVQRAG